MIFYSLRVLISSFMLVMLTACVSRPVYDPFTEDPGDASAAAFPMRLESMSFDSHGVQLNGRLFIAAGSHTRPLIILARGLPDYLGNLDIALVLQRAGFDVLSFNYRGCWGSEGQFSLTHAFEDMKAAIRYSRSPEFMQKRPDDITQIFLVGYSLGGSVVLRVFEEDASIAGLVLIDPTDLRSLFESVHTPSGYSRALASFEDTPGVQVISRTSVVDDYMANEERWNPETTLRHLPARALLFIYATRGNGRFRLVPPLPELLPGPAEVVFLDTEHSFVTHRVALMRETLAWLCSRARVSVLNSIPCHGGSINLPARTIPVQSDGNVLTGSNPSPTLGEGGSGADG